jgi:hypothetical protein
MGILKIERVGGLAGFGLAGSKLRSEGQQALSALSAADRASVENLFKGSTDARGQQPVADGFRYRITRTVNGKNQSVEVPEAAVPEALRACVTDRLD